MPEDRLDIIIMGATGYSGRYTAKVLKKLSKEEEMSWGIAGRNLSRLRALSQDLIEPDGIDVPVFVANIYDEESLIKMTSRAKVVINCCGPYRFYGEAVIKACIQTKTHHLDVSGEPQYMEEMQLRYHKACVDQGIYVVGACGMSGMPADLGLFQFVKMFNGTVNDIELFMNFEISGAIGSPIHDGTWASFIHGLAHKSELHALRKKLFSEPLPNLHPKIEKRPLIHKSRLVSGWCLPFAGADRSVLRRSQYLMYHKKKIRPVQTEVYIYFESLFTLLFCALVVGWTGLLVMFGGTILRNLLLKYPKFFSAGYVSHEGPTEKEANNVTLHMTFFGKGWNNKDIKKDFPETTNKFMKMKLTAKNPGYGFTCYSIILAATTIIKERSLLPGSGGVYPPGYAFCDTSLITKLKMYGELAIEIL